MIIILVHLLWGPAKRKFQKKVQDIEQMLGEKCFDAIQQTSNDTKYVRTSNNERSLLDDIIVAI